MLKVLRAKKKLSTLYNRPPQSDTIKKVILLAFTDYEKSNDLVNQ